MSKTGNHNSGLSSRGFTLLEFVIALTLLAMMAGVVFSGLRISINSYTRSQDRLEERARLRVMEDLARRQLGSLFPARPFLGEGLQDGLGGQLPTLISSPQAEYPLFYGTSEAVTFVTLAAFNQTANPGLTVVRYGLAEDEWGRRYVGALETRYTGLESFQAMVDIPEGKPLPLIKNVDSVRFEYYGGDPESGEYNWYEEWLGDETATVPDAIRILAGDRSLVAVINATSLGGQAGAVGGQRRGLFQRLVNQR